jgi:hypothetical protein
MAVEKGSEEERLILGKWIKMGQGLIVAGSAMGDSYLDPNIVRPAELEEKSQEYVKLDHDVAEKLPHLKGRFRWDLEKYYRSLSAERVIRLHVPS